MKLCSSDKHYTTVLHRKRQKIVIETILMWSDERKTNAGGFILLVFKGSSPNFASDIKSLTLSAPIPDARGGKG